VLHFVTITIPKPSKICKISASYSVVKEVTSLPEHYALSICEVTGLSEESYYSIFTVYVDSRNRATLNLTMETASYAATSVTIHKLSQRYFPEDLNINPTLFTPGLNYVDFQVEEKFSI
jgi:hypothetical protein